MERLNGEIRDREKVFRGLKRMDYRRRHEGLLQLHQEARCPQGHDARRGVFIQNGESSAGWRILAIQDPARRLLVDLQTSPDLVKPLDGMRVYYNYTKKHGALKGMMPHQPRRP